MHGYESSQERMTEGSNGGGIIREYSEIQHTEKLDIERNIDDIAFLNYCLNI